MKPLSHAQLLGRSATDGAYDRGRRLAAPGLAAAKLVRSSGRWRKVRAHLLSAHPICADPYGWHAREGRVVAASQVDHIMGLGQGGEAFDEANLQGLCSACHATKSQDERQSSKI